MPEPRIGPVMGVVSVVVLALACGASRAQITPMSGLAVRSIRGSLVISSLSGHGKRPLTKPRARGERRSDFSPTWSPDGSMVAFARWTPKQLSVMVVRSDGSGLRRVAALGRRRPPYLTSVLEIRWSPDGSRLAYAAWLPNGRGLREAIYVAAVDGSGAILLASPAYAKAHGLKPRGRVVAMANMGDSPTLMLNAPVPAARKVLAKAGLGLEDIDLFEINEAFAVVAEKFIRDLALDRDKVNVNGGAIALGHPIGATGSILIGTMLDELERRGLKRGLITMCAAGGMAPAVIIETV